MSKRSQLFSNLKSERDCDAQSIRDAVWVRWNKGGRDDG